MPPGVVLTGGCYAMKGAAALLGSEMAVGALLQGGASEWIYVVFAAVLRHVRDLFV